MNRKWPYNLVWWLPPVAWAAFIFFLSTRELGAKPSWWFHNADKVIHMILFGVLSILLYHALKRGGGLMVWKAALLAVLITSLYGGSDEIHQLWTPTRSSDPWDWLADTVGASCVFLSALRLPPKASSLARRTVEEVTPSSIV